MRFYIFTAFNLTIIITAVVALIRFRKVDQRFRPFLIRSMVAAVSESVSTVMILNGHQTLLNGNVYVLVEAMLLFWYLWEEGGFGSRIKLFRASLVSLLVFWITEVMVIKGITAPAPVFRIVYSIALVVLSINVLNKLLFTTRGALIKNASFVLCASFCIYFSAKALVQSFMIYGLDRTGSFMINVFAITIYLNLVMNLLHAGVILWMPKKQKFISPYWQPSPA